MRIVERSDTRLVLRTTPPGVWLFGTVFCGAAVLLFVFLVAARGDGIAVRLFFGVIAIAASSAGLVLYAWASISASVDLDKQRGSIVITRRRLRTLAAEEHPLGAIADVEVEASEPLDGDETYRLVFKMVDGSVVAPVPVSPHGREHHQRAASAIRAFLK